MKFKKPVPASGANRLESHGDLIASVYHLVDCFQRVFAGRNSEEARHYHDAAQTAFSAALATERRMAELLERIATLEETASTDDLTEALNRRGFSVELERALAAAGRYGVEGMLIFIDLDGFKEINDTHGHAAGDHILRTVACVLNENVRETDYVARLGGDEFAVLLTHTTHEQALGRAEIIDQILNTAHISWENIKIPLRASIGIQGYHAGSHADRLVRAADSAMYKTKRARAELLTESPKRA